jgi:WD40 repeat protein
MESSDAGSSGRFVPFAFPEEGERLLALNPRCTRLAVSCEDTDFVQVFDPRSGRKVKRCKDFYRVFSLEFLSDDVLLVASARGCFRCDLRRGGGRDVLPSEGWQWRTTVSPDRRVIAVGGQGTLALYDAGTGQLVRRLWTNFTYNHSSGCAAFSADGRYVATGLRAGREAPLVVVWDAHTGRRQRVFDTEAFALAFRGDALSLAVALDGAIYLYEADQGEAPATELKVAGLADALQSRDQGRALAALMSGGGFAQVRADTGEVMRSLPPPAEAKPREVVPSPDWSLFAGATADGVVLWPGDRAEARAAADRPRD